MLIAYFIKDRINAKYINFYFFYKILAHAYCRRPYFSKFFGGKIETVRTDVTKEKTNTKIYKISLENVLFQ